MTRRDVHFLFDFHQASRDDPFRLRGLNRQIQPVFSHRPVLRYQSKTLS